MTRKRNSPNEDDFLELAIRGDRHGLEYLVRAYQDLAYTIAIKIVINHEDAEEVVQDAFLKAFASLGNFRKAARFSTWLYRIVYNTALTKLNHKRPAQLDMDDLTAQEQLGMEENNGLEIVGQSDRKKYIEQAIGKLNEEDRLIITLHYIAEKSISEIGEIMDLKKSAIKMRLLRGRKQLETELKVLLRDELKDWL